MHPPMRMAAHAAAVAGALAAAGCVVTRPGGSRLSGAPREVEPGCVARGLRVAAPSEGPPASGRATFAFWVEADGSTGPIEAVNWSEGLALEGDTAFTNQVARAIARCRWVPAAVEGRPARALVSLPLRFSPSAEPEEAAGGPGAPEEIRPPQEAVAGCVPRTLPLPSGVSAGGISKATFLLQVEPDGSQRSVTAIGAADLDADRRRGLVQEVAAAAARCRFVPGTVDGKPSRTFWLVEVRFTAPTP